MERQDFPSPGVAQDRGSACQQRLDDSQDDSNRFVQGKGLGTESVTGHRCPVLASPAESGSLCRYWVRWSGVDIGETQTGGLHAREVSWL
jgi:hypothetical protein